MEHGTATAFVFSGRPDPVWEISDAELRDLERLWNELPQVAGQVAGDPTPALGYRGCRILWEGREEFLARGGIVTRERRGVVEHRRDAARTFERAVLRTAPQGLLPNEDELLGS